MTQLPAEMFTLLTKGAFDDQSLIVKDINEINKCHDKELYVAIGYHDNVLELIGCPDLESLPVLAAYFDTFQLTEVVIVLHGIPLDPEILPSSNDHQSVWVLFSDCTVAQCETLIDAAKSIEAMIAHWPKTFIEDFAVLVGEEVDYNPKDFIVSASAGYIG